MHQMLQAKRVTADTLAPYAMWNCWAGPSYMAVVACSDSVCLIVSNVSMLLLLPGLKLHATCASISCVGARSNELA